MSAKSQERGPSLHLDILEELFGKLWKRWAPVKPGLEREATGSFAEAAATFADLEVTLGAVVCAFAGRRISLAPAERAGGELGGILLLPQFVALGADPASNREHIMVRAALSAHAARAPAKAGADEPELLHRALSSAWALANEFHGFRERVQSAAALELNTRPKIQSLPAHERPIEVLRQGALQTLIDFRDLPLNLDTFLASQATFKNTAAEALHAPEPSFFTRLMRSDPAPDQGRGPLLLLGGPLTPTERTDAAALLSELEASEASEDAVEYDAPVRDHVNSASIEEDPYKENMPTHSFEKIDFADNFDGGFRKLDGVDEMDEGQESLDGVDLREMIRGGPQVESIYKAEIGDVGRIPDVDAVLPGERGVTYDEWDQANHNYRRDWVTLYPTELTDTDAAFGLKLEREINPTTRRAIAALEARRTERIRRTRQLDGDEIDLDGLIEEYTERSRGGNPPGRHYVHNPRLERDTATLVLMDISLSADSWVEDQRVLDIELAAACVVGKVADTFEEQLAILAFASNTRNLCRTWTVKGWKDSWAKGRSRLGALRPQGYTRIGPAIRHATSVLADHPARKKHLILITDGKPTDFDRYEGGHGIHDVAWSVREARRSNVAVQAIGLDPRAASILPAMFGPNAWRVLRHISELPDALVKVYD